jgi:transcriptional regulator with XRE-family HTH domain
LCFSDLLAGSSSFLAFQPSFAASGNISHLADASHFLLSCRQNDRIYRRFFPHMATHKLANYIRAYRRKSGLSQREVAYLLGCETGAQVSRYERRRRMPPVQTALACQAVFGTPVADLFAGTYESAAKEVRRRAQKLGLELQKSKRNGASVAQKLQWLGDHCAPQPNANHSSCKV